MVSVINEVTKEYTGKVNVKILTIDMDNDAYNKAVQYKVTAVPTLVFLKPDGTEYFRWEGVMKKQDIESRFKEMGVK